MYFVGVFFDDPVVDRLFDLARVIVDPEFARKAHITLRGPYKRKSDISSRWLETKIGTITLSRPATFFNEEQNTVYLRAEIPGIADFWYKPDYRQGVPHLSIYDGSDRALAWQILILLRNYPWNLELTPTVMRIIDSKQRIETKFILDYAAFDKALSSVSDRSYSIEALKQMHVGQRLQILDRICQKIHSIHSSSPH